MKDVLALTDPEPFDLDTMPFDRPVEGSEGMDANHASRMRIQFLLGQHASLVTQTQFADAKAAVLMTLMGLVALNGPVQVDSAGPHEISALAIFILMVSAIGFTIFAILPRFPGTALCRQISRGDRFSWPSLLSPDYGAMAHADFMRTAEASQLIMSIAQSNGAIAHVLHRKFRHLRIAFILGAIDLVLIVLYVIGVRIG